MDCETRIVKGWLLGSYEEKERFHEATDYKYEDFIHSADCCEDPYFVGDDIATIPGGCHMECDKMNMLIFNKDSFTVNGGITNPEAMAEWRVQLANAGYDKDHILFDEPRIYILSCMMY